MSATSEFNKNQFYTGDTEAETLLAIANELWELNGKHLLEPSVGAGAFPKAARRLGLSVAWTTNELYPDNSNWRADSHKDFLEMKPQRVDAVVGNPPYTGSAEMGERRMPLYEAFLHQAFQWADRVAFVLPLPVLRWRNLARLPEGVELVAWTTPKRSDYLLGGYGTNEEQEVATTIAFFERTGGKGVEWDGSPPEGLEWLPEGHPDATHSVCNWGAAGSTRCLRGSWGATVPAASELFCRITSTEIEALLATNAINEFAKTLSSASPSVNKEEMNHYLRVMQKALR
jgi:hypothetical protein